MRGVIWRAEGRLMSAVDAISALFFDVFGTLVDFRTSIARETEAILRPRGYQLDWPAFADTWRAEYQPAMEDVRSGRRGYCKLDILHRENLARILPRFGVAPLDDETLDRLNFSWHRLNAWPDSASGLTRLKNRYRIAPVSNGNISLMVDLARLNGFPWDTVLGAEVAQDFKPKPAVYLAACSALDLRPEQCMMVAAHSGDLASAAALGLRTAHVARPNEHGNGRGEHKPSVPVDLAVSSVVELADRLGA
jgi:2-haloacid dehalogenase